MSLDVYVGTLTRYYAGQWETIVARTMREQGIPFRTIRQNEPTDAVKDPIQIEQAIKKWRDDLTLGLGSNLSRPLDWPEGLDPPYFTDQPNFDGWVGLLLWAAYSEHPMLPKPDGSVKDLQADRAYQASHAAGFHSRYMSLLECEIWLPGGFDFTFTTPAPTGNNVHVGSVERLKKLLVGLNDDTWQATPSEIAGWRREVPTTNGPFERQARFGFAIAFEMAGAAVAHQLPMKLDY